MLSNEEIIRELYAAAEGQGTDIEKFVSMFSDEGYMRDVPSGTEFRGTSYAKRWVTTSVHGRLSLQRGHSTLQRLSGARKQTWRHVGAEQGLERWIAARG